MSHLVFVYGTLKRGHGNNRIMVEGNAEFVGEATTQERFFLAGNGIPFACPNTPEMPLPARFFRPVRGEVWRVDDATLARLDRLEGHPHGYFRRNTQALISRPGAQPITVDIYTYPRGHFYDPEDGCSVVDGCYEWGGIRGKRADTFFVDEWVYPED